MALVHRHGRGRISGGCSGGGHDKLLVFGCMKGGQASLLGCLHQVSLVLGSLFLQVLAHREGGRHCSCGGDPRMSVLLTGSCRR